MSSWRVYLIDAEGEIYRGLSAKGLKGIATRLESRGARNFARAYRWYAKHVEKAPKHRGQYCKTWVIYGNCPLWPHG